MGYVSDAQRKAVHASKADGGKGAPNKMVTPLNFGMPVIGSLTQNPGLNNAFMFGGGNQGNIAMQQMMAQQMQAEQATAAQSQNAAFSSYQDPNNASSVGFNSTSTPAPTFNDNSMDASLVGGVGTAPVATASNFNPTTVNSAEGIFGNEQARKIQPYKKPLINF